MSTTLFFYIPKSTAQGTFQFECDNVYKTESVNAISFTSNVIRVGGSCGDIEINWKVVQHVNTDCMEVSPSDDTLMFSNGMVRAIFILSYSMKFSYL